MHNESDIPPEFERQADELIAAYAAADNDADRESYLEAFCDDLTLIEILLKRLLAAQARLLAKPATPETS
jgi:hypothetical protein